MLEPIILRTFGELLQAGYRRDVLCNDCRRAVRLEAAALPLEWPYQGGAVPLPMRESVQADRIEAAARGAAVTPDTIRASFA